ncbi:Uncharacterised protein r2_g1383 [Pycnogonum litorale]
MQTVVKCVNKIRKALKHRQFKEFLESLQSEYGDVLYHSKVRWLSRGKTLRRFFDLRDEIKIFMEMKGLEVPELDDPQWLSDLAFLTDITNHLNELNTNLQKQG